MSAPARFEGVRRRLLALATLLATSPAWASDVRLEALLEYERAACTDPGYLDAGTHLLAAVRRRSLASTDVVTREVIR